LITSSRPHVRSRSIPILAIRSSARVSFNPGTSKETPEAPLRTSSASVPHRAEGRLLSSGPHRCVC